ncbi:hypothetical protein KM043_001316 [Ampulex compressa]|nr:hypothetical protein KM043_001316 [Ampulex compressa]
MCQESGIQPGTDSRPVTTRARLSVTSHPRHPGSPPSSGVLASSGNPRASDSDLLIEGSSKWRTETISGRGCKVGPGFPSWSPRDTISAGGAAPASARQSACPKPPSRITAADDVTAGQPQEPLRPSGQVRASSTRAPPLPKTRQRVSLVSSREEREREAAEWPAKQPRRV